MPPQVPAPQQPQRIPQRSFSDDELLGIWFNPGRTDSDIDLLRQQHPGDADRLISLLERDPVQIDSRPQSITEPGKPDFFGGIGEQLPTAAGLGGLLFGVAETVRNLGSGNPAQMAQGAASVGNFVQQEQASRLPLQERGQEQVASATEQNPNIIPNLLGAVGGLATPGPPGLAAAATTFTDPSAREAVQGTGNILAGSVPLVGAFAAEMGEQLGEAAMVGIGEGDAEEGGRLARNAAGQLTGAFLPDALPGAARHVLPTDFPKAASTIAAGETELPLLGSERPGARFRGVRAFAENVISRTFPGSSLFRNFFTSRDALIVDNVTDDVVRFVSDFDGDDVQLGKALQGKLNEGIDIVGRELGAEYTELQGRINRQTSTVELGFAGSPGPRVSFNPREVVRLGEMRAFINSAVDEISNLISKGLDVGGALSSELNSINNLASGADAISFVEAHNARKFFSALARRSDLPIGSQSQGRLRRLSSLMTEAMEDGGRRIESEFGIRGVFEEVQALGARWKGLVEAANESTLGRIIESVPERAHTMLDKIAIEDLDKFDELMRASHGEEVLQAAKARFLRDFFDDVSRGERTAVELDTGLPGEFDPRKTFQVDNAITRFERLRKSGRMTKLYGPAIASEVSRVLDITKRLGTNLDQGAGSIIAGGINSGLVKIPIAGLAGAAFGLPFAGVPAVAAGLGVVAGAVTAAVGLNLMARLMTRTDGVKAVRKFLDASTSNNARSMAFWGSRLSQLITPEDVAFAEAEDARERNRVPDVHLPEQNLQSGVVPGIGRQQ